MSTNAAIPPRVRARWLDELTRQLSTAGMIGVIDELASDVARLLSDYAIDPTDAHVRRRQAICGYWSASDAWLNRWLRRYRLLQVCGYESFLIDWLATVVPSSAHESVETTADEGPDSLEQAS